MYEKIKDVLKKTMSAYRYRHSIGVAEESQRLAQLYGVDTDKAYLAGLLHDCAKEINPKVQLGMCDEIGVEIDDMMKNATGLIHGPLGAEVARLDWDITDEEILGAIRWHTVGKAGMTTLEKIVYIADMTEQNRDFDGVEEIRTTVNSDLDAAILLNIEKHLKHLEKRGAAIHHNTALLRDDLLNKK